MTKRRVIQVMLLAMVLLAIALYLALTALVYFK